jgi:hypothetical protein
MSHAMVGTGLLRKVVGGESGRSDGGTGRASIAPQDRDPFEEKLEDSVARFRLISQLDELWNAGVARGTLTFDPADEAEITDLYRAWLASASHLARQIESRATSGTPSSSAREFLASLEDARGICTPDAEFFSGAKQVHLEDRAITAYHAGETSEILAPHP